MSHGPQSVDIVVTNYNYGRYVCAAVDSALGQSHPNVNVIVVDDGSTDDSRERLQSYLGAVDLMFNENGGQPSAFNAGFARCRGDVVIFLDADDLLSPNAASAATAAFRAHPDAARVQMRMGMIDAAGQALATTRPAAHMPMLSGDLRAAELTFPFDLPFLPTSGNAFRTRSLQRIFPVPLAYGHLGADWYLVHLTTLLGTVISMPEIAAFYRVHGQNGYEPQTTRLDLEYLHQTLEYHALTGRALARLAEELGLEMRQPIMSLANVSIRVISHRLEPDRHPIVGDHSLVLMASAVRAAARRFDVTWPTKALHLMWLGAIASSPRPFARWLAEVLLFPERRLTLNRLARSARRRHRHSQVVRPVAD
jgi:hypothetical protein